MENFCEKEGCERVHSARGLCKPHYEQWRRANPDKVVRKRGKWDNPDGTRMTCRVRQGCDKPVHAHALCSEHYDKFYYESTRGKTVSHKRRPYGGGPYFCTFPGCGKEEFNPGFCSGHYYQKLRGEELRALNYRDTCPVEGCSNVYDPRKSKRRVCRRHSALMKKFTLSRDRLIQMHENQVCSNGACGATEKLHIDHDHACCPGNYSCGKCIRGWLCSSCNQALGLLRDNETRIQGLADYVRESKNPTSR